MTTGPGIVDRVVVVRRVVDGAGAGATVVLVLLVTVDVDVVVVPAARVRSPLPPPPQAARATKPRAVSVRRTHLVSQHGPARDARAPAGRHVRPPAGHRSSRRGRGFRRVLPLRSPH